MADYLADFGALAPERQAEVNALWGPPGQDPMLRQGRFMVPGLRLGQNVVHAKFGTGIVTDIEGSGAHARVQVNFDDAGSKGGSEEVTIVVGRRKNSTTKAVRYSAGFWVP